MERGHIKGDQAALRVETQENTHPAALLWRRVHSFYRFLAAAPFAALLRAGAQSFARGWGLHKMSDFTPGIFRHDSPVLLADELPLG